MKRILFCSPVQQSKELGGSKVVVELGEEMRLLGWDCTIICPTDIAPPKDADPLESFPENLRAYLKTHAGEYDVVDYDHSYLPFAREEFSRNTLFVARSVLLAHHLMAIPIPQPRGVKAALGSLLKNRMQKRREIVHRAQTTVEQADLVNVSNEDDKTELIRCGISADKIVVIPYGISRTRRPLFDAVSSDAPMNPIVTFVGTFDFRKGAREFPALLQGIAQAVPAVRFKLIGTAGLFQTAEEVLAHFPKPLLHKIEVVPKFCADDLPSLLSDCSLGVFPSYIEGMPFGVLEMLAASVPVIAYDSPGPPMMLPSEYLVKRGDVEAMSGKVTILLKNPAQLFAARRWAKKRSQDFSWKSVAEITEERYVRNMCKNIGVSVDRFPCVY